MMAKCPGIHPVAGRSLVQLTSVPTILRQHLATARLLRRPPASAPPPPPSLSTPSPSHLLGFFHPSSVSVCSCLQNVMRQASRRKHGSAAARAGEEEPSLWGGNVLIKIKKKSS